MAPLNILPTLQIFNPFEKRWRNIKTDTVILSIFVDTSSRIFSPPEMAEIFGDVDLFRKLEQFVNRTLLST